MVALKFIILLLIVCLITNTCVLADNPWSWLSQAGRQWFKEKVHSKFLSLIARSRVTRGQQTTNEPGPVSIDNFLTMEEARTLLIRYQPLLRNSLHASEGGGAKRSLYRTSHSVRLPPMGDTLVFDIEERAAQLAGFPHHQVEDFQLACYGRNELYGLHRDDHAKSVSGINNQQQQAQAHRAATVLIYLQEPTSGGATLFTRRPLEEERDRKSKQPLRTEAGALELFQHYCKHPFKQFVVVKPQTGRAVTWFNWYGPNLTQFANASTHGACPVHDGVKCVIQQWISRSTSSSQRSQQPLRDVRVAAIFPAGADYSFQSQLLDGSTTTNINPTTQLSSSSCLQDYSTNRGRYVATFCPPSFKNSLENKDQNPSYHNPNKWILLNHTQGPYQGIGAIRLVNSGMETKIPSEWWSSNGNFTISFWIRNQWDNINTTLFSTATSNTMLSAIVQYDDEDGMESLQKLKWTLVYTAKPSSSDIIQSSIPVILDHDRTQPDLEWIWVSLGIQSQQASLLLYSRGGIQLGHTSLNWKHNNNLQENISNVTTIRLSLLSSLSSNDYRPITSSSSLMTAFLTSQPNQEDGRNLAFVASPPNIKDIADVHMADLSMIVIHNAILDEDEIKALRYETYRYDINR